MLITILKEYKSIKVVPPFELPDFCVLTGKNGAGKSHLLSALADKNSARVTVDGKNLDEIKYIPFGGLNPTVNSDCNYMDLINQKKGKWNQINMGLKQYKQNSHSNPGQLLNWKNYINDINQRKVIEYLLKFTEGDALRIDEELFNKNYSVSLISPDSIFSAQMATIFKLYYNRLDDNRYHTYRNKMEGDNLPVLKEEDFETFYGPKPWELINSMMKQAHLPYEVNEPNGSKEDDFHLSLRDPTRGIEIQVNDLSTGEKVLMSLALAIYNTSEEGQKPDLLLLDEPDAPLHPEYSKLLIDSIKDSIVQKAKVKVIITTHSPTTVAMADEESLYRMDKDIGKPVKTTKAAAISLLTKGLDNLRVSVESRRQVFVESKYDVHYYEKLFELADMSLSVHPCFLAPNSYDPSCSDVEMIVGKLSELGNDLVYGIIDFDNTNHSEGKIIVNGEDKRYTMENYLFDPIYVALLLIRESVVFDPIPPFTVCRYSDIRNQTDAVIQEMIDYVVDRLGFSGEKTTYTVKKRSAFFVCKQYFEIPGHDLEQKIIDTWPQLNKIKRGHTEDNIMKNYMIDTVISDYPEFLSTDFEDLFRKII